MCLVSIVIPIYNVEKYLEQCIISILEQSYNKIEVLLIDDGSTDKSKDICDMFERKDIRVHAYHKSNGGLSDARNYGMTKCNGKYVMFVDGDDWLDKETVSESLEFAERNELDIVFFTYKKEYENQTVDVHVYEGNMICDKQEDLLRKRLFGSQKQELKHPEYADSLCSACMKMYRKSILDKSKVLFQPINVIGSYEDGLFNLQLMKYTDKTGYLDKTFYHYRKTNTSSLTSTYKSRLVEQWNTLFGLIDESIIEEKLDSEYRERLENRITLSLIGIGLNELCSTKKITDKKKIIKNYINTVEYKKAIKDIELECFPLKWRIFFWGAKRGAVNIVYILLVIMDCLRKRGKR